MGYKCLTINNRATQEAFLKLPKTLYQDDCPQNISTEKQLLRGRHSISPDITISPFVVVGSDNEPICRCIMTYYGNDDVAYVGFFESQDDIEAVKKMFGYVERKAIRDGKTSLLGPIDASIYINYRFKTDHFDKTYTGEPYNKKYYKSLWEEVGFVVCDRYLSNQMRCVEDKDFDERLDRVYKRYLDRGYEFIELEEDGNFEEALEDVYDLLMELYASFPGYKALTKAQFVEMYSCLENVINNDMVKLVYKGDELRAFCIALPNYGTITRGRIGLFKFFEISKIRNKPTEYVILYAGADKKSPGLGGALMHVVRNELYKNQCTSIGALIHEGNMPANVYKMLHTDQYHYVLMKKNLG